MHTFVRTHTCMPTYAHWYGTRISKHTSTNAYASMHTLMFPRPCACTHLYVRTRACTHIHERTRLHAIYTMHEINRKKKIIVTFLFSYWVVETTALLVFNSTGREWPSFLTMQNCLNYFVVLRNESHFPFPLKLRFCNFAYTV